MAAPTRTPRGEWIRQGLRLLAEGGPDAVRIEPLAKELGVSRGGFYWHFEDRSALLTAMLDTWERATTEEAAERLESEDNIPAKLRRLFTLTSPGVVKTDLAIRDWARRDHAVAERLQRIDNRRMVHLRALFAGLSTDPAEVEARCMLTFSLLIGNHYITAEHGSYSRTDVLELALDQLARPAGPGGRLGPGQSALEAARTLRTRRTPRITPSRANSNLRQVPEGRPGRAGRWWELREEWRWAAATLYTVGYVYFKRPRTV